MAVSVGYVARETASNLWRNRVMTIASVLVVAVSLFLVGGALLARTAIGNITVRWQHGVSVIVWVSPTATAAEQQTIHNELTSFPHVQSCVFRSQAFDYSEAKGYITPDAFRVLQVSTMPSSYRCRLDNPTESAAVTQSFSGQPGVVEVSSEQEWIRNMETAVTVLQWAALGLAIVMLVAAVALILNTIRLAIFARRREVSVMKLVGATNWFIRVPFMCEGFIQGLVGALLSAGGVIGLFALLVHLWSSPNDYHLVATGPEVALVVGAVVVLGAAVGTFGSAVAVRRFLDT